LPADAAAGADHVEDGGEGMEPFGRQIGQRAGCVAELDEAGEDAGGGGVGKVGLGGLRWLGIELVGHVNPLRQVRI